MIDAVDLLLAEDVLDDLLQLARGLEVDAERLLDDAADVDVGVVVEVGLACSALTITGKYSGAVER